MVASALQSDFVGWYAAQRCAARRPVKIAHPRDGNESPIGDLVQGATDPRWHKTLERPRCPSARRGRFFSTQFGFFLSLFVPATGLMEYSCHATKKWPDRDDRTAWLPSRPRIGPSPYPHATAKVRAQLATVTPTPMSSRDASHGFSRSLRARAACAV